MITLKNKNAFSEPEKKAVYRAIYERRDIRREFLPEPIPRPVLLKILDAAHHAGSVGFMQPWNFIVIEDAMIKARIKSVFRRENEKASKNYTGSKQALYRRLKLEGIEESPVNLCVTCHPQRGGPNVLGRNTIKETDLFSTSCAVQNLWLAARSEGIGLGWVSILDNQKLCKILKIPKPVIPIAYLCLGYVTRFPEKPMLETEGWAARIPLEDLIYWNQWNHQ